MQLHAVSIGQAVPRESFDAVVQSVFESAVNLRLVQEDRLLTVLLSEGYELPQGIRIARKDVPLRSLRIDQRAAARGGVLRFDPASLVIDLRSARVWKCRVPELGTDMSASPAREAWAALWELLNKEQIRAGTDLVARNLIAGPGSPLSQKLGPPALQILAAAEQLDARGSLEAAQKMLGLGPGVTPSGDDVLIGFLAGLWSQAAGEPPRHTFIQVFGSALVSLAAQTTEISRTYLYHAARGEFSSSLSNLAAAVSGDGALDESARIAMKVGHSSGMDTVTGLLLGLAVWNRALSLV